MEPGGWSVYMLQISLPKDLSVSDHPGLTVLLGSVYRATMPTLATPRDGPHTPSGPNLLDGIF